MAAINHIGLFPYCLEKKDVSHEPDFSAVELAPVTIFPIEPFPDKSPFKVTLDQAMAIQWRIKKWKYSVTDAFLGSDEESEFGFSEEQIETSLICFASNFESAQLDGAAPFQVLRIGDIFQNNDKEYFADIQLEGGASDLLVKVTFEELDDVVVGWGFEAEFYEEGNPEIIVGTSKYELRPIEYWEYDPNDGNGPIYDKDTGSRIR